MPHKNIFKKILFCTDFNTDAATAFFYALNIAEANNESELIILHVIPEPDAQFWKSYISEVEDVDQRSKEAMDKKISEAYLRYIPEGIHWTTRCVEGNVGERILETAQNENTDLIVMGRGAGANIINRMLGNFTEKVVKRAACPVMIIPGTAKED